MNQERREVKDMWASYKMVASEQVATISAHWYSSWKRYVDFDNTSDDDTRTEEEKDALHPGEIDNSNLASDELFNEPVLKPKLQEGIDFEIIPRNLYNYLLSKYKGGPNFFRVVLNKGSGMVKNLRAELYPMLMTYYSCKEDGSISSTHCQDIPPCFILRHVSVIQLIKHYADQRLIHVKTRIWIKSPGNFISDHFYI